MTHYEKNLPAETKRLNKLLSEMGFSVNVQNARAEVEDGYLVLKFWVTLLKNNQMVHQCDYTMGSGFLDLKAFNLDRFSSFSYTSAEESLIRSWKKNPTAKFLDHKVWASAAEKTRAKQGVVPQLADVMYCLLMEGAAYVDGFTFGEWCDEYGYSDDSIKAREMFDACDETGRRLSRVCDYDNMREIFQDY